MKARAVMIVWISAAAQAAFRARRAGGIVEHRRHPADRLQGEEARDHAGDMGSITPTASPGLVTPSNTRPSAVLPVTSFL